MAANNQLDVYKIILKKKKGFNSLVSRLNETTSI